MEYKYSDITEKVLRGAMNVHSILGNGFQEVIYQRALEIEFRLLGVSFGREISIPVFYKGELIGERRVDFLIEGKICVELKALVQLENVHLAQAIKYLEAYDLEVGLPVNFGSKSLQHKQIVNKKVQQKKSDKS